MELYSLDDFENPYNSLLLFLCRRQQSKRQHSERFLFAPIFGIPVHEQQQPRSSPVVYGQHGIPFRNFPQRQWLQWQSTRQSASNGSTKGLRSVGQCFFREHSRSVSAKHQRSNRIPALGDAQFEEQRIEWRDSRIELSTHEKFANTSHKWQSSVDRILE